MDILQLSISTAHSWRSSGKYLRFIGQEAVIVILLPKKQNLNELLVPNLDFVIADLMLRVISPSQRIRTNSFDVVTMWR